MKQERNIITMDEYGRIHFPSTTNNDIWMNTNELIELFGIKYSILRGNSFRLNTLGAYKVRECVMNKLTTNLRNQILFLNVCTHECMNKSKYGLN